MVLAAVCTPALGALGGCRASLTPLSATASTPAAEALLQASAAAHGSGALAKLHDINVSYVGTWHRLVTKLQPALVDAGFRGGSEERLLLKDGIVAQAHDGPDGHKQVVRHGAPTGTGGVRVWFNDVEAHDEERLDAAALVADGYGLFLLGPLLIDSYRKAGRSFVMQVAGPTHVVNDARRYECDQLRLQMKPGLGRSPGDQLALYIDRETHLMRRVRFTLEGLASTRGALVEVDTFDPIEAHGVQWPTRFHERLLRPGPLKVHDWQLTGLDVDRGYAASSIDGGSFVGTAQSPARPLPALHGV